MCAERNEGNIFMVEKVNRTSLDCLAYFSGWPLINLGCRRGIILNKNGAD